ncbi:polyketide synthase [Eremomyces bilateralis CBS 781.70]|uniref:Polyketide synthase n=1 Tax=Eremomyces bilateralis CBS 781.70 TaxID=1392243 RepID=A0A6G1G5Y5_9PEZI|nr:polyketide synthase [Eremomyces bilateralis CBS 781.70]KAF1813477.1 polyketide synthase [Eremomyces bilateralis CBS 781.70]
MSSQSSAASSQASLQNTMNPDPSVIIGMACRVPGATTPSKLWDNIAERRDLQSKMPADRFNVDAFFHPNGAHKGTMNARYGYFLEQDLGMFDAGFFGISGKEAEAMDPQQRLLLEVVYEALENAGITLDEISGSLTSVFCGSFTNDYMATTVKDLEYYPQYSVTGTGNSILSNRISYFYNLHGASVTCDTACSSSLIALHWGNGTLQNREADISIVVGSALHYDMNIYQMMTDLSMLSTDGRSRAFDNGASGYVRGEGICATVLKRRSDAVASGDSIRAIVRGTMANHDGRKAGITLPNPIAQEQLIRHTYKIAGLDPADTQYFEAHGTGTKAGDPRETSAIGAVFAPSREEPLYVGSVKTNVGHLEGASGLAGIIKTVMGLEKRKIPPNMLFKNPNPEIKFDEWKIRVPTSMVDWPEKNGVRRASINSFGYGGTNAHVILEAYTEPETTIPRQILPGALASMVASRPYLIPLTSHIEKAGKLHISALTEYLDAREDANVADLAFSLSSRRTMHPFRSFAIGHDRASVTSDMTNPQPLAKWTAAESGRTRIGMVFTGQGAQHFAMGRELIQKSPLFKQSLEKCDTVLQSLPDAPKWLVIEEMTKSKEDSRVTQTEFSQPLCTALQLAIVDLLNSWGIKPAATVGHSSGEMAAAYAAGILTFEGAIIAAYYRGLYMSNTSANTVKVSGGMMAIGLTEPQAKAELQAFEGRLAIAAINSPSSITISGDEDAILELKNTLVERKVFARQLQVAQAFHSHHMFPLAPAYERALNSCPQFKPQPPTCRMFSSVTARLADYTQMGAAYWAANMTGTVRFYEALTGILLNDNDEQNVDILLEIGAHAALKGPSRQGVTSLKLDLPYLGSLTRGVPDYTSLLQCAGQLFSLGYPVDLVAVNKDQYLSDGAVVQADTGKKQTDLPTYSWDHNRYWCETRFTKGHRLRPYRHTILGSPITGSIDNRPRWRNFLRPGEIPWLNEHVVDGKIIFPGAGYISMAIEGALRLKGGVESVKAIRMKDIMVKSALIVSTADMGTEVLLEMKPVTTSAKSRSAEWYEFGVYSYDENERCSEHCHGLIAVDKGAAAPIAPIKNYPALDALRLESNRSQMPSSFYAHLNDLGLQYGENFRLVSGNVESGPGYAYGPITYDPTAVLSAEEFDKTVLHPSLLDSTFHVIFSAIESRLGRALDEAYVPSFIRSLDISGSFVDSVSDRSTQEFNIVSFTELPTHRVAVSDLVLTQGDHLALEMQGLEVTALGTGVNDGQEGRSLFFRQRWQPSFDSLTSSINTPSLRSLASVVDVFVHQHPDTRILTFSANSERVTEVLKYLGTAAHERRRFKCLDIAQSSANGDAAKYEEIKNKSGGLVDIREPNTEELYDLVIISDGSGVDPLPHMKDNAVVIYDGANLPTNPDLEQVFYKDGILSAYRRPRTAVAPGDLTVIVSSLLSKRVSSIISAIKTSAPASVNTMTFAELSKSSQPITKDAIVLSSFDEGIDDADTFAGIKKLLGEVQKNVVWVTEGAVMESSNPAHAMVIGLARTARSENDQLRLVTLDLPVDHPANRIVSRVFEVLDTNLDEDELCERNDCLYIPRVEADDSLNSKLRHGFGKEPRLQQLGSAPLALKFEKAGLLETLHFAEDEQIVDNDLGQDELEIEVRAAPVNFRDVAAATGSIEDNKLGDECAGVVLRIGSAVSKEQFQVGDRVIALRPGQGAHKTIVRNPASLCHKLTGPTTFATVSTMPLILCTAYYSLLEVGRLGAGDTVLIHSAAGGVGQMAIQLARRQGARVLATCSTKAKRDLLRNKLGVPDDQIFSSTDDSFVAGVLKATNGQGVDVVLNSLSGPLLQATWECMNAFGRFVEIGNKDISQNSKISMDPFRRSVTFSSVDLKTMYECNKSLLSRIFNQCCKLVNNGEIVPPESIYEFSYGEAEKAFRMVLTRTHPGKAVLVPSKDDMVMVTPTKFRARQLFSTEKTYLLVGGLGGLGRTLAEWMIRKGATKIAFLSRSGTNKSEAKQTVDWLLSRNVSVSVHKGDVSILADVEECIKAIGPSLAGIFQAAMVLQDAPLESMTYNQWTTCTKPKCLGTYYLHRATLKLNLDFFVCFSSVANPLGSKAQANYAAANHYLDSLMRLRREMGLVGTSMNVGAITGIGVIAHDVALQKVMERLGMDLVNEEELLYQIETAVTSDCSKADTRGTDQHTLITGINLKRNDVYWATKPLLRNLYANHDFVARDTGGDGKNLTAMLAAAKTIEEKTPILLEAFIEKIAAVLAVPVDNIMATNPLSSYGLDSIVAVEFRKWFRKVIDVDVALFDVLGAKSIQVLVQKAASLISTAPAPGAEKAEKKEKAAEVKTESIDAAIIPKADLSKPIPMSTFQSRLWFVHNFLEDKSFLNLPLIMHIKGKPNMEIFLQAFQEMVRRNPILTTAHFEGDEFAEQRPNPDFETEISMRDLSQDPDPKGALEAFIAYNRRIELNIEEGEVFSAAMAKLGEDQYVMVNMFHHIAVDRGSSKPWMDRFAVMYDAMRTGKDIASLATPSVSYADFTVWHNELLASPAIQEHVDFWKNSLKGAPDAVKLLPFSKVPERPQRAIPQRAVHRAVLGAQLLNRMKRICAQSNATPFHFLMAAFRAFLFRYTEDKDIVMLMIDGNRPHPDLDELTGFFVNMIPLRHQDDCSEMAFDELLALSSERTLTAMQHTSVPFDAIVDFMEVPKKPEHFPLGQVAINYQVHGDWPPYHTEDFDITKIESDDIPTACELQLEALEETDKGLSLRMEYSTPLYRDADMERFLDNFLTFLSASIRDHRQPIAEIPLCGDKELTLLKEKFWNQEYVPNYWGDVSILERIHNFAEATPHKTAVKSSNGDSVTYAQLAQRAGSLAKHLRDNGATDQDVIGVLAVPGVEQIIGIVAALINGGAYLPMDPEFAVDRLAFMASDANTRFILTSGELSKEVSKIAEKCTNSPQYIRVADACSGAEVLAYNKTPDSKNPFYMIYTSGSTGKPKGVVLTHGGTQGMLSNLNHDFGFCASDKMLHQSSMCFDLSVTQIFTGLTAGGTLCVASRDTRRDPTSLADFINVEALTFTYFTPTHFTLLLEQNAEALKANKAYRIAFFAGERFPVRVAKAFYDLGTPATAYNLWAPSETTVQNTKHTILYPKEGDVDVPIGFPLANNHLYLCDNRMQPLPFGFIGEICVGGVQTGAGYLNRPEKTAETFVLDPFATDDDIAQGWTHVFRTGDRGRYRPDAQLEFHGRLAGDKQIKLRGFRIDLGEVEQRLYSESQKNSVNGLADVAVVARNFSAESEDSAMDERQLVAYLIAKSPVAASQRKAYVTKIHAAIAENLNSYMLPNGYVFLDNMPQLPSAKVDRQNLLQRDLDLVFPSSIQSAVEQAVEEEEEKTDEVENKLEDDVLKLFRDVLGAGRTIELNDNFFERGGNSILMVRLQSKLKRTYKIAPPLPEMVKKPFPSALVEFLRNKLSGGNAKTSSSMISWSKEAMLPFDGRYIPRYGTPAVDRSSISGVLLTGAESYIGLHLLAQLLAENPSVHVHVLGSAAQITMADLEAQFVKYQLFSKAITKDELVDRVSVVSGYLGPDHFGLNKQDFKKLARNIQSIYHLGGMVSLLQSYSSLREHNVKPILDLLELASQGDSLTELVYLSTWSVLHLQAWKGSKRTSDSIITTEEPSMLFTPPESEEYGYFKTRWVAENLLQQAASRGFPVTIARSSAVSASTTTNAPEPADGFISRMILDMIDSGLVPEMKGADASAPPSAIDFVPVDYLVSTLVTLTSEQKLRPLPGMPDIRHIGNVAPMKLSDLPAVVDHVRPRKGGAKLVPLEQWLTAMENQGSGGDADGETIKYTVLSEFLRNGHVMFALDQSKTERALRDVPEDVQCPPVNAAFLKDMWLRAHSG